MGVNFNPSRVIQKFRQKELIAAVAERPSRQGVAENAIDILKTADCGILAYLWIAMEQKRNIIILCEKDSNPGKLLDALAMLMPPFYVVQEISNDNSITNHKTNFVTALANKQLSPGAQLGLSENLFPDVILSNARAKNEMKELFRLAELGISFITLLDGSYVPLVKRLRSKYKIKNQLCMLDIAIVLEGIGDISRITEYRWLERAEIAYPLDNFIAKDYKNSLILKDGKLDMGRMDKSKIIQSYAKSNIITAKIGIEELKARQTFLESMPKKQIPVGCRSFFDLYYDDEYRQRT